MKVNDIVSDDFLTAFETNTSITPDTVGFWDDVGLAFVADYGSLSPSAKLEYIASRYSGTALTARIIRMIFNKYGTKWARTLETLNAEYNPIYNTEWKETQKNSGTDSTTLTRDMTRTDDLSDRTTYGRTDTTTHGETVTFAAGVEHVTETEHGHIVATQHGETITQTIDTRETNTHSISADNAAGLAAMSADTQDRDGTETSAHNGTDTETNSGTDTITDTSSGSDTTTHGGTTSSAAAGSDTITHGGTVSDTGTDTTETEHGHIITTERAGNIGVTTSAELVADEIKMRALHIYMNIVVNDVRAVLCGYTWG